MGLVAKRVCDKRILRLIRDFLTAGVLADGLVSGDRRGDAARRASLAAAVEPDAGRTGQGIGAARSSLCPLRRSSRRRGLQHRRAEPAGGGAGHGERRTLPDPASQLRVNSAKSAVARPAARKFLGFSFTSQAEPRRRIAPLALARFASRVRALTRRTAGSPDGWDGRAEPDLVRPRGTLVVSVISGTCSRLRQNTEPDSRVPCAGYLPWTLSRRLPRSVGAHGSSPWAEGPRVEPGHEREGVACVWV